MSPTMMYGKEIMKYLLIDQNESTNIYKQWIKRKAKGKRFISNQ